jgi:ATP-dependent DNA helicase DinG
VSSAGASLSERALAALDRLTEALPAGEHRAGQREMAAAVAEAIRRDRHLVVQAGTGTGKSLAYLVPAVLAGRPVVVATATKALQDQLAIKDLPFLEQHLDIDFDWAVLKGRANYACRQRLAELGRTDDGQLGLDLGASKAVQAEITELRAWAEQTRTGDRSELPQEPSAAAWAAVSVSSRECPGATNCPHGGDCFTEVARARAAEAAVIVVNLHLYGLDVAAEGGLLPEHAVVVVDEAHQLEDILSATAGLELAGSRFGTLAKAVAAILDDEATAEALEDLAPRWSQALAPHADRLLPRGPEGELASLLDLARERLDRALAALRAVPAPEGTDAHSRAQRAVKLTSSALEDLAMVSLAGPNRPDLVSWVTGPATSPTLRLAPLDVGEGLAEERWPRVTAVLTSATVPPGIGDRIGLPTGGFDELDVGSPFAYDEQALLYCAAALPDPRSPSRVEALHDELSVLIRAAGGRTLALFTSYRAMDDAAEELRTRLPFEILTQRDLPKPALIDAFAADEATCLFATMGFWQGIDVPGRSLSLVTIDRLPFPRPDDPLLSARRERAGPGAFRAIDLPRAITLLAQGSGRLIRNRTDRGVVAVLDPRLATNASYRWDIVNALPPMRRTRDRAEAEKFLREITSPDDG